MKDKNLGSEKQWMNILYAYYHSLLTEKQSTYLDLYFAEDLSLGEIADKFGVSRQAVYDNIKKAQKLLTAYEAKLGMIALAEANEVRVKKLVAYITTQYPNDEHLKELVVTLLADMDEQ